MRRARAAARWLAALWLAASAHAAPGAAPPVAAPVEFVALGDMPYGNDFNVGPAYRHLIDLINGEDLPVAIHVGDIKSGLDECTDALYAEQVAYFARFAGALVYTPGDNDWIDCQRRGARPLERLEAVRRHFFPPGHSLGRRPIAVDAQGALMPQYARWVENLRWRQGTVLFVTFHTVGPNNGLTDDAREVRREAAWRDRANAAWIRTAFQLARETGVTALVLATQADPLHTENSAQRGQLRYGFDTSLRDTLFPLAAAAPFPVLLVHGDSHRFHFDQPFHDAARRPVPNLWRLEVPGHPRMHAVRVRVQPGATPPFHTQMIWNPMSPDPGR